MKKLISAFLAVILLISMTACERKQVEKSESKKSDTADVIKTPDLNEVFETMKDKLPSNITVFDNEYVYDFYGIDPESCKQEIIVSVYDAAGTYEIWLIEAKSEKDLATIKGLAEARLKSMCEQFQNYDANAYELALNGKIITEENNCLVMIVADNAEELFDIYYNAC